MAGIRKTVVLLAVVVAAAVIGGLAWNLLNTQAHGREQLRQDFDRRAALTAKLIGAAFTASNPPTSAAAQYGGSRRALAAALRARAAVAGPDQRVIVLDEDGRALAASSPELMRDPRLLAHNPHLRVALGGRIALSDSFRGPEGRPLIEIAVPFDTPSGRRVAAGSGPIAIVRNFTDGVFASASATPGAYGYLIDGHGRTLNSTGVRPGAHPDADAQLRAALRHAPTGSYGDRTYVSAGVPASRWRVVLSVPTARLYSAIDNGPSDAAWLLLVAFTAAICALLALGVAAVRGARHLAAATERERVARELAQARLHDPLTGLPNRSLFEDRAAHAIDRARRHGGCTAVFFVDADRFKRINDSLGHEAGDAVLREVGRRLAASVRASDSVSRLGGDEFVVLCEDIDGHSALRLVTGLQAAVDGTFALGDREVPVSVSIGVAIHEGAEDPRTASELVRDADAAMYRAKDLGRGRVEVFDSELHDATRARLDAEVALRQAIDDDQLVVHYQPIVSLPDGRLRGVEALVRWRRDTTGELVPPGEFIPLAEEAGLIGALGERVLRTAIRDVGDWARRGLIDDEFALYVNVSARQLADTRLACDVADALAGWDRPPAALCLEITESAVMLDPAATDRTLEKLDGLGVRLALDDFGAGHSSLGQLARSLPISVLKLDRSFVAAMDRPRDRGILEAAAALARALELSCVAEGVESAEQAGELAAIGFPYAQGFHFGRPQAGDEIAARLSDLTVAG